VADRVVRFLEEAQTERWRLLVFPYALRYEVAAAGNIDIVAVAHAKREPGYFRARTG
jgi:hypothetical protein